MVSLLLVAAFETTGRQSFTSYMVAILSNAGLRGAENLFTIEFINSINIVPVFLSGIVTMKFGRRPASLIGVSGNILGNVGWLSLAGQILKGIRTISPCRNRFDFQILAYLVTIHLLYALDAYHIDSVNTCYD